MDKIKKFIPWVLLLAGVLLGWFGKASFTKKCEPQIVCESEIVYRDTCIADAIVANISTETKTTTENTTKAGKTKKDISIPAIETVTEKDSVYTTVFVKEYNYGLVKMKFKTTVKAKSAATAKHELDYQLDTLLLKEMTTVVNTVVVDKGTDDSNTVKYLPVETAAKNTTWLGVGGSVRWDEKPLTDIGLTLQGKRFGTGLFIAPEKGFKDPSAYRLQVNMNLLKVATKD